MSLFRHNRQRETVKERKEAEKPRPAILNEVLLDQYEAMDANKEDNPLLPRIFEIFQRQIPELLKRLTIGLQKRDETDVSYVIHRMLGLSHNAGAMRMGELLLVWEKLAPSAMLELDDGDILQLIAEFECAKTAIVQRMNIDLVEII